MNDIKKFGKGIKGLKKFYIPRLQTKFVMVDDKDLRSSIGYKNLNTSNEWLNLSNFFDKSDGPVMVISATVANLRRQKVWTKGWKPLTEYVQKKWSPILAQLKTDIENYNIPQKFWAFEKLNNYWSEATAFISKMPDNSTFKKCYEEYKVSVQNTGDIFDRYGRIPSGLKTVYRRALHIPTQEIDDVEYALRDARNRCNQSTEKYDSILQKTYPVYKLFKESCKSYNAEEGWYYNSNYLKTFLEYAQLVDKSTETQ
jgi:hypothetical protein